MGYGGLWCLTTSGRYTLRVASGPCVNVAVMTLSVSSAFMRLPPLRWATPRGNQPIA